MSPDDDLTDEEIQVLRHIAAVFAAYDRAFLQRLRIAADEDDSKALCETKPPVLD